MAKVTVFSSVTGEKTITSEAKDWGELKTDLRKAGINYSKMKAVIGETQNTMEIDESLTPEGDYTLFLMPTKTKSGMDVKNMNYKEIRAAIKQIISDNPDAAKFFNKGRNYTNKSTSDIRKLLGKWWQKNPGSSTPKASSSAIAQASEETAQPAGALSTIKQTRETLKGVVETLQKDEFSEEFEEAVLELESADNFLEDATEILKEAEEEIQEILKERLAEEEAKRVEEEVSSKKDKKPSKKKGSLKSQYDNLLSKFR